MKNNKEEIDPSSSRQRQCSTAIMEDEQPNEEETHISANEGVFSGDAPQQLIEFLENNDNNDDDMSVLSFEDEDDDEDSASFDSREAFQNLRLIDDHLLIPNLESFLDRVEYPSTSEITQQQQRRDVESSEGAAAGLEPPKPLRNGEVPSKKKRQGSFRKRTDIESKPTRPLSAYNVYVKEMRNELVSEAQERQPDGKKLSFESIGKLIGQKWKELDEEGKSPYERIAHEDRKRYDRELKAWKQYRRQRMRGGLAVPNNGSMPEREPPHDDKAALTVPTSMEDVPVHPVTPVAAAPYPDPHQQQNWLPPPHTRSDHLGSVAYNAYASSHSASAHPMSVGFPPPGPNQHLFHHNNPLQLQNQGPSAEMLQNAWHQPRNPPLPPDNQLPFHQTAYQVPSGAEPYRALSQPYQNPNGWWYQYQPPPPQPQIPNVSHHTSEQYQLTQTQGYAAPGAESGVPSNTVDPVAQPETQYEVRYSYYRMKQSELTEFRPFPHPFSTSTPRNDQQSTDGIEN